jgi:hypothetical protein
MFMIILLEAFKIEGERSTDHFHFCRIAASFNKPLKTDAKKRRGLAGRYAKIIKVQFNNAR